MSLNKTLYGNFPWLHTQVRGYIHDTAAFLAWHRGFIHIFEAALKEKCNYSGHLTYWDWVLDWEDITKSPVWDSESGFGGDWGGEASVGSGSCVVDGPFAHLTALSYGVEEKAHCLSRGFLAGTELEQTSSRRLKPEAIDEVLNATDYESFNLGLEHGPHNGIPYGVRGDFLKLTAPYDPVFFLHHTQLDRLWWIWQQSDASKRLQSYSGLARGSSANASLDDMLNMHGLVLNVRVLDIMSTETDLLCYRYPM